jgi:hypothetical protein
MFSVKLAKALIKSASDDATKQVLNYVQIKDGVATVTDGHRMVNIEAPDEVDGLYHRKEVEMATKIASAKKTEVVLSSLPKTDKTEAGQYPRWEQLIPSLDGCRVVAFNATYLKEMCELAIASGDTKIEMHIPKYDTDYHGNLYDCCTTPVMMFWKVGKDAVGRGLLMPLQLRDGFLKWKGLLPSGKATPKKREKVAA